jgi:hypothetical protein
MNVPWIVFVAITGVVFLVAFPLAVKAYFRFRKPRAVRCPETGGPAEVRIDPWHAAVTAFPGPVRMHVEKCSLWPAHERCGETCVAPPALEPGTSGRAT